MFVRSFVKLFDRTFDRMFDRLFDEAYTANPSYPPYNIVKTGDNKFDIEVALAGFNKKDINVTSENGMLTIESKEDDKSKDKDGEVLHKGISKRYFKKSFTIADDCKVTGAELKDGLLKVSLEKVIPEHKKARTISIK